MDKIYENKVTNFKAANQPTKAQRIAINHSLYRPLIYPQKSQLINHINFTLCYNTFVHHAPLLYNQSEEWCIQMYVVFETKNKTWAMGIHQFITVWPTICNYIYQRVSWNHFTKRKIRDTVRARQVKEKSLRNNQTKYEFLKQNSDKN